MDISKHAYVLAAVSALHESGSYCGKTHVQKSLFLVQELAQVKVPLQYVLYKHGPYSFDLEAVLEEMKSYDAITILPVEEYGVVIDASSNAAYVRSKHPLSPQETRAIESVCHKVGSKNVKDLERLATAVWVNRRMNIKDFDAIAEKVHELKPHIPVADAKKAIEEVAALFPQNG